MLNFNNEHKNCSHEKWKKSCFAMLYQRSTQYKYAVLNLQCAVSSYQINPNPTRINLSHLTPKTFLRTLVICFRSTTSVTSVWEVRSWLKKPTLCLSAKAGLQQLPTHGR